jgi:hypothetical protein
MENTKDLLLDFKSNRDYKAFSKIAIESSENLENMLVLCVTIPYPFPQYSSWLLSHVAENHLDKLLPFHNKLIDVFLNCADPSAQRNLANTLLKFPETAYKSGEMMDCLFQFLQDSNTKVALKAYAMYLLVPLVKPYPELRRELKLLLNSRIDLESRAYLGAVKKVENMLDK